MSTVLRRSDCTGGRIPSLSKTPSGGHNGEGMSVSCGVQSSGVDKEVYELPAIESLGVVGCFCYYCC